jgi:outer membrane protein assembly factor BamD (BamD/ComL family)
MKAIIIFFALLIGGMIFFQQALQNGSVLRYIDTHRQQKGVPEATYYIGESYYLFQNLPDATTYFLRVAQRYPDHPLADDAYFAYLQCLDDSLAVPRNELAEGYQAYIQKYPRGKHVETAQTRVDNYRTGASR